MDWIYHGKVEQNGIGPRSIVFLPGWSFNGQILQMATPVPGWWSPAEPLWPERIGEELDVFLEGRKGGRIILIGWSLGARLAMEFAVRRPEAIDALVLLSLRRHWPEEELAAIRSGLAADPVDFMLDFYRKCFLGDRQAWRQFAAVHLKEFLMDLDLDRLEAGLASLAKPLDPLVDQLGKVVLSQDRLWLLHGEKDIIAPFEDRFLLPNGEHLAIKGRGHAIFLAPEVLTLSFLPRQICRDYLGGSR